MSVFGVDLFIKLKIRYFTNLIRAIYIDGNWVN